MPLDLKAEYSTAEIDLMPQVDSADLILAVQLTRRDQSQWIYPPRANEFAPTDAKLISRAFLRHQNLIQNLAERTYNTG